MRRSLIYIIVFLISFVSCGKEKLKYSSRTFYMGVTPYPPDFTKKGYDLSYGFVQNHCDLISHHFDDVIPWNEAYNHEAFPQKLMDDLEQRKSKTPAGKKVLLSVSALKISRVERAGYYKSSASSDIVNAWNARAFDDTTVIAAYVNYIEYMANYLNADYINFGVESNSGSWNATTFNEYKQFLSEVHTRLKIIFPDKPCFISFMIFPDNKFLDNAKQLEPYTDWITISAYPYSYVGSPVYGSSSPDLIPDGLFQSYVNINSSKPFAVAETGYIAQDLDMPTMGVHKIGTEQWQADYVNYLFDFCEKNNAKFIIWFCAYDYDAAINTLNALGQNMDLFSLWKDIGFYDEKLRSRQSASIWINWNDLNVIQ